MINELVDKTVLLLMKNGLIHDSEVELYHFGINRLYLFCINIVTTIAMGVLCGMIWQSLLFSVAYIPLRRFAGGYHSSTPGKCYFWSIILIFLALRLISDIPKNYIMIIMMIAFSSVIVFSLSPIESENKPLSNIEKIAFKRKATIILIIEVLTAMIFLTKKIEISLCIVVAILCSACMLIIARLTIVLYHNC